ncbi:hypothetical protein [Spirosoma fluviale]|uniref:Uncharacterized protein n=1 Tax=Spirosoma fluviale TaxID=1597977 RepID=A0A286G5T7_9BACT|nr:hypothetical protein [Spirosoma fluviale]SOD90576.1 hypothetical protein SAMN06269250_3468 [Spirosoma fluviale]
MIVTLDVFSGRPNPSWRLSEKNTQQLLERVANKALAPLDAVENTLGFRGLTVTATSDEKLPDNVTDSFRLGGSLAADYAGTKSKLSTLSGEETDNAVRWLLSTGQHAVDQDVLAYIQDTLQLSQQGTETFPAEPIEEKEALEDIESLSAAAACIIQNTAYNPGFWNVPAVQSFNNCYNYAMNYKSNTFAQPGRISGHPYAGAPACNNVGTAANWDGCKTTCSGSNKNVALVIWPGVDYHWYRRHSAGFWAHKPGQTAVRNTDNLGRIINGTTLTPQNCSRGPYTIFCGYRFSPTGMKVR